MARLLEELTEGEKQDLVYDMIRKKNGELDEEWADIVANYELDMSGDTLRKAGVGVKLAYDAGVVMEQNAQAVMMGVTPDQQTVDPTGYAERQKMRDLVRENNKVYRAEARDALLREAVREAAVAAGVFDKVFDIDAQTQDLSVIKTGEMVVAIGDIHFGEIMDVRGFLGEPINFYNEAVCSDRMKQLLYRIRDIQAKENTKCIHVMVVGDCIAGMLRMSQLQNLQYGIVDATMKFSELFARWVKALADMTEVNIDIHLVGGNHDEVRPLGSKAGEFPKDNMIKIIQWYLEAKLDGYGGTVRIHPLTGKYHYVEVEGYNVLMLHGEGGKIQDLCRDAVNVYGHHVDYFICGHLHHEEEIASGTTKNGNSVIVRVPSLCGMDGFAQKLGRYSKPGATVMILQQGFGRRCIYPIVFNDNPREF